MSSSELVEETKKEEMQPRQQEEKKRPKKNEEMQASMPIVPFPQRLEKEKIEEKISRFLDMFKKIEINIPFAKALAQMPNFAKFLKDILCKKRRFAEEGVVNLTATYSIVIQRSLPVKMQHPGSFTIPCTIGKVEFKKALCDSGPSINLIPLSTVKRLNLGEVTPTNMTLQMEDMTMAQPKGVSEDVLMGRKRDV